MKSQKSQSWQPLWLQRLALNKLPGSCMLMDEKERAALADTHPVLLPSSTLSDSSPESMFQIACLSKSVVTRPGPARSPVGEDALESYVIVLFYCVPLAQSKNNITEWGLRVWLSPLFTFKNTQTIIKQNEEDAKY